MEKHEFIKEYQLSDALPVDPTLRTVPAEAFASALKEFTYDRFRGIARVSYTDISCESILISAEYTAYFFRSLLSFVYGRVFIDIDISSDREHLTMIISSEEELPITDSELRFLVKTARNAGMEFYLADNKIKLKVAFSKAAIHRVYAVSVSDGKQVMLSKLCEMFYCGSPCTVNTVKLEEKK